MTRRMKAMTPEDLRQQMLDTYFYLRVGIVILSFVLPLIMLGYSLYRDDHLVESSISAFYGAYDGAMRDWLVGILWSVGSFLILYKGFSHVEDWALNVAGAAAILLSINPCHCWSKEGHHNPVHTFFAITFFVCMIFVCWFCAYDTITLLPPKWESRFENAFRAIGAALAVALAGALLVHLFFPDYKKVVFGIEWASVWLFATYWAVKSTEFHITAAEARALKGEVKKVTNFGLVPMTPAP